MKLYEALQQLIGEYGITVIRERRLVGLLAGLGVLGFSGIREVMEAFAADGCAVFSFCLPTEAAWRCFASPTRPFIQIKCLPESVLRRWNRHIIWGFFQNIQ